MNPEDTPHYEAMTNKELQKQKKREAQRRYRNKRKQSVPGNFIARQSLSSFVESTVDAQNIGSISNKCNECGAFKFKGEQTRSSLCCSHGSIKLPTIKAPPKKLQNLLQGNTNRDCEFRGNIRSYNSSLAFASMQYTGQEYEFRKKGPYCFTISGHVYHSISQMVPEVGKMPSFSQIYIYDRESELDNQLKTFSQLDQGLLKELQDLMKEINPYARQYCHVGDVMKQNPSIDIKLVLKASGDTVDLCRYNLPTGTDIAVIMPAESSESISKRDIVVYKSAEHHPDGKGLMTIGTEHPMYDPPMYVLKFPYDDKGYELGSYTSHHGKGRKCTSMQYYMYRLMPHSGDTFNAIHRMGQLFQQYIVDMCAKIEQERLNYIRYHQKEL